MRNDGNIVDLCWTNSSDSCRTFRKSKRNACPNSVGKMKIRHSILTLSTLVQGILTKDAFPARSLFKDIISLYNKGKSASELVCIYSTDHIHVSRFPDQMKRRARHAILFLSQINAIPLC